MPWFKVDDTLAFHAKTVAAGNAAMGLWVRAGSWSAQQLEGGFVPDHMVTALGKTSEARRLADVGLWARADPRDDGRTGYVFHQWTERNPTRTEVEQRREDDRQRKADARAKAKEKRDRERAASDRPPDDPDG